jgi:putative transposase
MDTSASSIYRGYRFPGEIIAHCVWLYFRFSPSFRDIQEMTLEPGVDVSHETIRLWGLTFGAEYARRLRRRRVRSGDTWHLDEVFCKINGQLVSLWRAVDQSGEVLDVLMQKRRDGKAAKRFFRKLLKAHRYVRRKIVTDKLRSYGTAKEEQRFKSARHAQRFLSVHGQVSNHFRPGRHLMRARNYRALMLGRFATWSKITAVRSSMAISA